MARILLVDDDQAILDLEKLFLTEEGHQVFTADNAKTGLEMLFTYDVDLVIVDILMPKINGFQFINSIKGSPKLKHISIAFLSSRTEGEDVMRAAKLGADFYLIKPIDRKDYINKVHTFFQKKSPATRPQVNFQNMFSGEAKIRHPVQLVSISDVGIEILIDQPVEEGQVLEISAAIFEEIPLRNPTFKVLAVKPYAENLKKVELTLTEDNVDNIRKIKSWVSTKNVKTLSLKSS